MKNNDIAGYVTTLKYTSDCGLDLEKQIDNIF